MYPFSRLASSFGPRPLELLDELGMTADKQRATPRRLVDPHQRLAHRRVLLLVGVQRPGGAHRHDLGEHRGVHGNETFQPPAAGVLERLVRSAHVGVATSRWWNTATGAPIGGDLVAGAAPITIAAIPEPDRPEIPFAPSFSPDGLVLFVGSEHPMTWLLDIASWRAAACAIAGRELKPNEWARYLAGHEIRATCTG